MAVAAPIVFVLGEMVPKNLFQLHADMLLARGSRLLVAADSVLRMTGIVWALKRLAEVFSRLAGVTDENAGALLPKRRVAALLQDAITENDVASGSASDKKLRGVYCLGCSGGIMTMETLPLTDEEAREVLRDSQNTRTAMPLTRVNCGSRWAKRPEFSVEVVEARVMAGCSARGGVDRSAMSASARQRRAVISPGRHG